MRFEACDKRVLLVASLALSFVVGCGEALSTSDATRGGDGGQSGAGASPSSGGSRSVEGEPECVPADSVIEQASLWADERGVFVLSGWFGESELGLAFWQRLVRYHDGKRTLVAGESELPGYQHIHGVENGPLFLAGSGACGVVQVTDGESVCSAFVGDIGALFVVSPELAFAAEENRVIRYDGTIWSQLAGPPSLSPIYTLWASDQVVVAGSVDGIVYVYQPGDVTLRELPRAPAAGVMALWGFSENDLWLGNTAGQVAHYDGAAWTVVWSGEEYGVRELWGADGTLYFHTTQQAFRVREGQVEAIATLDFSSAPEARIWDVWGRSADEVYFVVENPGDSDCTKLKVLRLDGNDVTEL